MTDAEIKYAIEEYVTAKWNILEAELKDAKKGIEERHRHGHRREPASRR